MQDKIISEKYNILDDEEAVKDVIEKTGMARGELEDIIADIQRDEKKQDVN